jgi:hypothetical protein
MRREPTRMWRCWTWPSAQSQAAHSRAQILDRSVLPSTDGPHRTRPHPVPEPALLPPTGRDVGLSSRGRRARCGRGRAVVTPQRLNTRSRCGSRPKGRRCGFGHLRLVEEAWPGGRHRVGGDHVALRVRRSTARIESGAAMYVPFAVLLVPYWLGAMSSGVLMMGGHGLMILRCWPRCCSKRYRRCVRPGGSQFAIRKITH